MSIDGEVPGEPGPASPEPAPLQAEGWTGPRLYVHEPGWRVEIKRGSAREFCYAMTPGQDHYHRLMDGEIVLHHDTERLCLACAARRGIVTFEARGLPDQTPKLLVDPHEPPIPVLGVDDDDE